MNQMLPLAVIVAVALTAVFFANTNDVGAAPGDNAKGKLRHVVLFKYKEGTAKKDIKTIVNAFRQLPKKIDSIIDFEYGENNSPEGLDQGYTHVFLVTFKDDAGRAEYLPHPAHKAFVDILLPHLEEAHVMDYFAKD